MAKMVGIKELSEATGLSQYEIRMGIRQHRYPAITVGNSGRKYLIDYELFMKTLKERQMANITAAANDLQDNQDNTGYSKIRKI